jgi:hypothetical protein
VLHRRQSGGGTMKHLLVLTVLLVAGRAAAQDAVVYRLNFALQETENGKNVGVRNYTMLIAPQSSSKLNSGTKIPLPSGPAANQQYTYVDVGVSVRARVQDRGGQLLLAAEVELSNLGAERENAGRAAPRIQQLRADIDTAIPLGKATSIASLDDPVSPRHYDIEVTATKIK